MILYIVDTGSSAGIVAACTTFDAAADRAIALLERQRKETPNVFWLYTVRQGEAIIGTFTRDMNTGAAVFRAHRSGTGEYYPYIPVRDLPRDDVYAQVLQRERDAEWEVATGYKSPEECSAHGPRWVTVEQWKNADGGRYQHARTAIAWYVRTPVEFLYARYDGESWWAHYPGATRTTRIIPPPTHVLIPGEPVS